MKKALVFMSLVFIFFVFDVVKAQDFYNTTYKNWKLLGPGSHLGEVVFTKEGKYFVILSAIPSGETCVDRYDRYGNFEERRCAYFQRSMGMGPNYFTWDETYFIIPVHTYGLVFSVLEFLTFNYTAYKEGGHGLEIKPYSTTATSVLGFTYHLTVGIAESNFNNPPVAYMGYDGRIHVLYNFFDINNNTWSWDSRKDIIIDSDMAISELKRGYIYPSTGVCRIFSNCYMVFIYEGRSTQNANRYGIYVREIRRGIFGLEFHDIPLISTTDWGCYNFNYCYNGKITYWRIGTHYFEANKIIIRLLKPDNTYDYFFFKFNPYNFYREEDIKINVMGSNAIAPYARKINATLSRTNITEDGRFYYWDFVNFTRFGSDEIWISGHFYVLGASARLWIVLTDAYNSSDVTKILVSGAASPPGGTSSPYYLSPISVDANKTYNITLEGECIRFVPHLPPDTCVFTFYDLDIFAPEVFRPHYWRTYNFFFGKDVNYYQEAIFLQVGVMGSHSVFVQEVSKPRPEIAPRPPEPERRKITRSCEYMNTYPSNTYFVCDIEDIQIPSNAVNISVRTKASLSLINATAINPTKTFEMRACSPIAYIGEDSGKCNIAFLPCTPEGLNTVVTKERVGLPGTTITSNVHANVSIDCFNRTGFPAWVKIKGTTEVEYDIISLTEKRIALDVDPTEGNETTEFRFYLSTYNLAYPYNLKIYVDGEEYDLGYKSVQNYVISWFFYGNPGVHSVYFKVRDSAGWEGITDTKTVLVVGIGIAPFTLYVSPKEGNVTTNFRFYTSMIYNGTPPYTVKVHSVRHPDWVIKTCTLQSSGICSFYTTLPCGNDSYIATATDSRGSRMTSNIVTPKVICAPQGTPLKLTLTMTPQTGDTRTIFNFTLKIEGGVPPYYVNWYDWGNLMCGETYTSSPPFSVQRRFRLWSGSHGIDVHATSSDGQKERSNQLRFDVAWGGEPDPTAFDCTGEVGGGFKRVGITPTPTYQEPIIDQSTLVSVGAGWMGAFFTPFFISTIMLIGISGLVTLSVAKYSGGDMRASGAVFLGTMILLMLVYAVSGIYPSWIVILFIIFAGLIFAKFILGVV